MACCLNVEDDVAWNKPHCCTIIVDVVHIERRFNPYYMLIHKLWFVMAMVMVIFGGRFFEKVGVATE
jgi:hypothetical protein